MPFGLEAGVWYLSDALVSFFFDPSAKKLFVLLFSFCPLLLSNILFFIIISLKNGDIFFGKCGSIVSLCDVTLFIQEVP